MDTITLNAFITYLQSRTDELAKSEYNKLKKIAEECKEKKLEFIDVSITKKLWFDFQDSRNLN